jgi:hypothetical protein
MDRASSNGVSISARHHLRSPMSSFRSERAYIWHIFTTVHITFCALSKLVVPYQRAGVVLRAVQIRRVQDLLLEDCVVFRPFPAVVARVGLGDEEGKNRKREEG